MNPILAEYHWWRDDLIPHAWGRMKHDYCYAMGWTVRGCDYSIGWLRGHGRKLYLALCGFLLAVAAILAFEVWLCVDYGLRTQYADGFNDGFSDSVPVKCAKWWSGASADATRWRFRQQLKGK